MRSTSSRGVHTRSDRRPMSSVTEPAVFARVCSCFFSFRRMRLPSRSVHYSLCRLCTCPAYDDEGRKKEHSHFICRRGKNRQKVQVRYRRVDVVAEDTAVKSKIARGSCRPVSSRPSRGFCGPYLPLTASISMTRFPIVSRTFVSCPKMWRST